MKPLSVSRISRSDALSFRTRQRRGFVLLVVTVVIILLAGFYGVRFL